MSDDLDGEAKKLAYEAAGLSVELEEGPELWLDGNEPENETVSAIQTEWIDPWGDPFTPIDAFKPRPTVEHLVSGLLRRPSLNMLFGPPGALKTLLTLDLCIAVAAGMDWLPPSPDFEGGLPYTTIQAPTMFIDFDNGEDDLHERIEALTRGRNLDPDNLEFYYYSFPEGGFIASNKAHIGDLMLRIQQHGIGMVWIDNLGIIKGGANENADEMIPVMNNFRYVAEKSRAVVGLVHHQNKSQGFKRRSGESIRGHSSIEASLNLALLVDREEYGEKITIKPAKMRGGMIYPFAASFAYEHKIGTSDLESAIFFGAPSDKELDETIIDGVIKAALKSGMLNQTNLINAVKQNMSDIGINRIRDRIERMAAANMLLISAGARNAKFYQLV